MRLIAIKYGIIITYLCIPSQVLSRPSNGIVTVVYVRFLGLVSANSRSQMENIYGGCLHPIEFVLVFKLMCN